MRIEDELYVINGNKPVKLDNQQKDVIEEIANNEHQLIFLWGSHGTGKTLLGIEAAKMMVAKCIGNKKTKQDILLYVIVNDLDKRRDPIHLLNDVKNYFNNYDITIKFKRMSEIVKNGDNVKREGLADVKELITNINGENAQFKIVIIDEVTPKASNNCYDWRPLAAIISEFPSLKLILCLSPVSLKTHQTIEITSPSSSPDVLSRQLFIRHRSSHHISQLSLFAATHDSLTSILSTATDIIPSSSQLPQGDHPTWFHFSSQHPDYGELSGEIEEEMLTVIWDSSAVMEKNKDKFCWEGCRYSHVDVGQVAGTEAENVLLILSHGLRAGGLVHEAWSRARNNMYLVTSHDTSSRIKLLLEEADAHQDQDFKCEKRDQCEYVGKKLLNSNSLTRILKNAKRKRKIP